MDPKPGESRPFGNLEGIPHGKCVSSGTPTWRRIRSGRKEVLKDQHIQRRLPGLSTPKNCVTVGVLQNYSRKYVETKWRDVGSASFEIDTIYAKRLQLLESECKRI